jgi:asparagine synthase (glutamine-hydrolysing)
VTRSIAGIFDPHGRSDNARLAGALGPQAMSSVERGPLRVNYSGPAAGQIRPLCLLDGHLDNAQEIAVTADAQPGCPVEEVLAAAYLRWGVELLPRLRGDFVLLIWDHESEAGLLARDQLGVRCLYLHDAGGAVCFANEIRDLLAVLPRRPAPDRAGVAHWVAASNRAGTGTLYEGVRRLQPGGVLELSRGGAREWRYWNPRFVEGPEHSEYELSTGVREEIARAVRRRLATGPGSTGVLMSGGLDSASVAAMAAREAPGRVEAYSGVFPEHPAVDESDLITQLRSTLGLPGVTAEVRAGGLLESALEYQRVWQVPTISWGDFWTLPLLRAAAAAGAETVLGGDGGDELFDARVYLLADQLRLGDPREVLRIAREIPGAGDEPPRKELARAAGKLALVGALPYGLHEAMRRPLARRGLPLWLTRRTASELIASEDPLAWKRLDGPRWWAHAAYGLTRGIEEVGIFELHRRRASMAGLEARHPLLDLDLVELVLGQAPLSTFDRHLNRSTLRAAMAGMLPDAVRLRPQKARFDSLITDTLAGADRAAVRRLLSDPKAELGAYVELDTVRRTLLESDGEKLHDPFQWMQQVWRLSTAECWLRAQADPEHESLSGALQVSPARVSMRAEKAVRVGGRNTARQPPSAADPGSGERHLFPPQPAQVLH